MNIAFDAGAIEIGKGSGVGNYTLHQFESIIRQTPSNQYFYFNIVQNSDLVDAIHEKNFHKCYFYAGKDALLRRYDGRYQDVYGEIVKAFIRKNQIDVFYITSPFFSDNVLYKKEWFESVVVVATAWDIIPYVMRKQYLNNRILFKWYMTCIDMLRWTDRQLAISNSVKEDMVHYLQFNPEKIDIIYGGVSGRFRQIKVDETEKSSLFRKFGINNEYLLCCVSADQRKNVRGAVEAFSKLPRTLLESYQMVIVGRILPEKKQEYTQLLDSLGISSRVVLTDYVTDEELLALYNLAKLMIFPSLYEGFGLPVLEAWACGTPVIASQNSSLGEIVGDAGLLFDPRNTGEITKTMVTALTTADWDELLAKGREKVKKFTWDWVGELTLDAINTAVMQKKRKTMSYEKIALVYPPVDLGRVWDCLPVLLKDYFTMDVYTNYPEHIKSGKYGIFPTQDLERYKTDYDWLVVIAPDPVMIHPGHKTAFQAEKSIWLVADEALENLLRRVLGLTLLAPKAVSDAAKVSLSHYFDSISSIPETSFHGFDKTITANPERQKNMVEQSLAHAVYLINPLSGETVLADADPQSLIWALAENLYFAIHDEKPWGNEATWAEGEQLLNEFGAEILSAPEYSREDVAYLAHSLGYAFSASPRRLLAKKDFPEKVCNKDFHVNLVTSWNTKCGIAEFTKFYYEAIRDKVDITVYPNVADVTVRDDESFVVGRYWKFRTSLARLARELLRSDAPIVHIQYTEGFFRVEDLTMLLEKLQGVKKVVVTCHNSAFLIPRTVRERQLLNEAVYVVHQKKDLQQLQGNGIIAERLHLIPLGQVIFPEVDRHEVRRQLGISGSNPIIGSYGFLFPHKGILETIQAVAQLKNDYPNILYIPCCAIYSGSSDSEAYYQSCQEEIHRLKLMENVKMIPAFLEAKESAYLLQACDITIMAYGDTQESASGAVRFCIAAKRPLITTRQNIFREFADCTLQIQDNSPRNIAQGICSILNSNRDSFFVEAMNQKAGQTNWNTVSRSYLNLYKEVLES